MSSKMQIYVLFSLIILSLVSCNSRNIIYNYITTKDVKELDFRNIGLPEWDTIYIFNMGDNIDEIKKLGVKGNIDDWLGEKVVACLNNKVVYYEKIPYSFSNEEKIEVTFFIDPNTLFRVVNIEKPTLIINKYINESRTLYYLKEID